MDVRCYSISNPRFIFAFCTPFDSRVIFGRGFGCLDDINHKVPFEVSLKALLEISGRRLFIPFWKIHEPLTGVDKKVQHHNQVMEGHIQNLIDERRRDGHSAQNPDLLQLLLEAKDDDGQPLTDDVLISNLMTMVVIFVSNKCIGLSSMCCANGELFV